jgi:carboxypeptidase Taq
MSIEKLQTHLNKIACYRSAAALLQWDLETGMPVGAATHRADTLGELTRHILSLFLSARTERLLDRAEKEIRSPEERSLVTTIRREWARARKIPIPLQVRMSRETAAASLIWRQALEENDFKRFAPALNRIIHLSRETARHWGYDSHPYDALLDRWEPGLTTRSLEALIQPLQAYQTRLLERLDQGRHPDAGILKGRFPQKAQETLNTALLETIGFDFNAGRVDTSRHPFSLSVSPGDIRVTTRYRENDFTYSFFSAAHEGGHALYEQGIPPSLYMGEDNGASMGIHESQSRFWENVICRGRAFWVHFYPALEKRFPIFRNRSMDTFWRSINRVHRSLIRTEADEVTYNLHIILRYRLEKELIAGILKTAGLPDRWREETDTLLGLVPATDQMGVLQDIHWSAGAFGYFPSYMLGNLYAAQWDHHIRREIPDLSQLLEQGRMDVPLSWLRERIHRWGKSLLPGQLTIQATGEPLNPGYYMDYLCKKFGQVYQTILPRPGNRDRSTDRKNR